MIIQQYSKVPLNIAFFFTKKKWRTRYKTISQHIMTTIKPVKIWNFLPVKSKQQWTKLTN